MQPLSLKRIEGKYEILDKLGEGGMGAVYKVRHRLLDELRVIKVMRQHLLDDEGLKNRFFREARVAIKLRHPNIAHLYDFSVDDDGIAFIVLEYIEGMTLEDALRYGGPPSLGLCLEVAGQTLQALAYLHGKGFIHRDISPDNLMLTRGGDLGDRGGGGPVVKLIDLGIAKTLEAGGDGYLTQTGTFLGKIRYSPPEQFGSEGASTIDARGDLYAFGIVLYELLTGRYPIQGRDSSSIMAGHLFRPPLDFAESDPDGRVPPGLRALVLRTLAKTAAERPASARELAAELASFRSPGDLDPEELGPLLRRAALSVRLDFPESGSTQARLDGQFGIGTTPLPRQDVRVAEATIRTRLEGGDLVAAESALLSALDTFGEGPELSTLRLDLRERRERELVMKVQTALAEARGRIQEGDLDGAAERLNAVCALDPESSEAGELLQQIEAKRREAGLAAAVAAIDTCLAAADLEGAARLLPEAVASFGDSAALRQRWERAEELRRGRRQEEKRKETELGAAVATIDACLDRGDLDGAARLLPGAVVAFGGATSLRERWERLERARGAVRAQILLDEAEALRRAGDPSRAARKLRQVLEIDPRNLRARELLRDPR